MATELTRITRIGVSGMSTIEVVVYPSASAMRIAFFVSSSSSYLIYLRHVWELTGPYIGREYRKTDDFKTDITVGLLETSDTLCTTPKLIGQALLPYSQIAHWGELLLILHVRLING